VAVVVTLTPNPSLDRTIEIPRLRRGEVLRATSSRVDPGGKGVNVARALLANGRAAVAVLPTGGAEGAQLSALLADEGVDAVCVPIGGSVRANVTVAEPDGTVTKLNEPGPVLTPQETEQLLVETVGSALRAGRGWVVGCGSLSPGMPSDLYASLVRRGHEQGLLVAVDSSGPPLLAALAARPDLLKPNAEELAELVGRALPSLGAVVDAARELLDRGVGAVLVSLGPNGALLVGGDRAVHAQPPAIRVASTVGAGDCALAGFLAARTGASAADDETALAEAVTWGAAAAALPGTRMPGPEDLSLLRPGVRTDRDPDWTRPLDDHAKEAPAWTSPSTT